MDKKNEQKKESCEQKRGSGLDLLKVPKTRDKISKNKRFNGGKQL